MPENSDNCDWICGCGRRAGFTGGFGGLLLFPAETGADEGDGEVARRRQPERVMESIKLNPDDCRQKRPAHRPEHIGQIQKTETLRVPAVALPDVSHHERKRRAHAHAPRENGTRQHQRGKRQIAEGIRLAAGQQKTLADGEQFRDRKGPQPDDQFRAAIKKRGGKSGFRRSTPAIQRPPAQEPTASPSMKTDSTTDSTGVMMPNDANAMRVQTT